MAKTSLARRVILDSSSEPSWVGIALIISKILSWSPCGEVFVSGRSGDTVLLGVSSCLVSFIGSSAKSFDVVI